MASRTKFIAEIADNHGGDMKLAKEFIRILASIGVDYVKFQSWQMARVRDPNAEPYYDWLVKAELTDQNHIELLEECEKHSVKFLTTVFDYHRVDFLSKLGLSSIKVGSAEVSNHMLLSKVRKHFKHVILSTGMHTRQEIEKAAKLLSGGQFTLMHCVSLYPHSIERSNLSRILWLKQFTPSVGFSDHSSDIETAKMAIVLGVDYIERHTAFSKHGPGRVSPWDTTPDQWERLVRYRELFESAWGEGDIPLSEEELKARKRFIGRWTGKNKS